MNRYIKQMLLPEIGEEGQRRLAAAKILMVGAGGLGAAALPYLAGAGVGRIAIADDDKIEETNLHRQTIFKNADTGGSKAAYAAAYARELNPLIKIDMFVARVVAGNAQEITQGYDLIIDGSDNFETKTLLNAAAIENTTPLVSASVEGFNGMAGIFAGHEQNAPCYRCLYPALPLDACNCNEGGILGTVAGLAGLYQAHLTLCYLLNVGEVKPGTILAFDFKNFRLHKLNLKKNADCPFCNERAHVMNTPPQPSPILLVKPADSGGYMIVDVRKHDEVEADPIDGALHMPLDSVPERYAELPKDRPIAFACVSNRRSRIAAEYMRGRGYNNVYILDRTAA